MSNRISYTRDGFLRRVSMSHDASLFVIVEGKVHDPYFVDKICGSSQLVSQARYEVRSVTQIESGSGTYAGGKAPVVSLFDHCKSSGKLSQRNSSGWKRIAFIVDRDAQHLTGGRRRSPHLIYTRFADCEAHIFSESNETEALAVAASLDHDEASDLVAFLGDWRKALADDWRPWIELCYVAEAARSRTQWVGLGKASSLIHKGPDHRTLDNDALVAAMQAVEDTSLFSGERFKEIRLSIMKKIDRIYIRGNEYTLLKGKWLPDQLTLLVAGFFDNAGGEWNKVGFKASVTRCYASNLDMTKPGASEIRAKLEALL